MINIMINLNIFSLIKKNYKNKKSIFSNDFIGEVENIYPIPEIIMNSVINDVIITFQEFIINRTIKYRVSI